MLLGVLWAAWHLPLFFFPGADTQGQSFPVYRLVVTARSVAIAWLYANTRGSLLPVMLLVLRREQYEGHRAGGRTERHESVGAEPPVVAWLTVAVLWGVRGTSCSGCERFHRLRARPTCTFATPAR